MLHDINQYGVHREHKTTTTLKAMTKAELIKYIRMLEHDYNVSVDFNERQARNTEYQKYKSIMKKLDNKLQAEAEKRGRNKKGGNKTMER